MFVTLFTASAYLNILIDNAAKSLDSYNNSRFISENDFATALHCIEMFVGFYFILESSDFIILFQIE